MLRIGELVLRTGVAAPTLRSWERRHGLVPSRRTAGNQRLYPESAVDAVAEVQRARASGLPLGEIARWQRAGRAPAPTAAPARPAPAPTAGALRCPEQFAAWLDGQVRARELARALKEELVAERVRLVAERGRLTAERERLVAARPVRAVAA
jgi:DNA-binding transcriptional MerR regulator